MRMTNNIEEKSVNIYSHRGIITHKQFDPLSRIRKSLDPEDAEPSRRAHKSPAKPRNPRRLLRAACHDEPDIADSLTHVKELRDNAYFLSPSDPAARRKGWGRVGRGGLAVGGERRGERMGPMR